MSIETELAAETEKWLSKAKKKRLSISLKDESKTDILKNVDAYISDAIYFFNKGDTIRAFEAIIWSWSIIELGLQLNIFKQVSTKDLDHRA